MTHPNLTKATLSEFTWANLPQYVRAALSSIKVTESEWRNLGPIARYATLRRALND